MAADGTDVRLPEGTVTFLLTDVEGSTSGWEGDRAAMAAAVVRHYEIIDRCVRAHGGVRPVEQGEGDSVVAAFALASDAVRTAVDVQLALAAEPWPDGARLAVRAALHTGEAQLRDACNYMGRTVIRTARLRAIAHGGQILCSGSTADVARDALPEEVTLSDLGAHRLKDLGRPEHVFQICHPRLRQEFPPLRSLDAVPNNLPVHLTSFIGREAELAEVGQLVRTHRLVTLTGSGGAGKTRLAARVAADLVGAKGDGAWWVELAPLADPALVTEALLGVLGVADAPGRSAEQRLTAYLAHRDLLVVLDNCEHLVEACAAVADVLLRTCPKVTVLATSREALGVGGEVSWKVPPLALPDRTSPPLPSSLSSFDAVALFVDRALRARPNFEVTNTTAPVVAEICARLDGIPLAIELAAARTRVLTPQQILVGLEDRFRLLTGGARGAMPRQQTLEASVAWSHDLLSGDERLLFRRLSVFTGGFTLDAAEAVGPDAGPGLQEAAVLDLLDSLVAKSLVVVADDAVGSASRYRMLETVRDFATLSLARAEETADARDAHLRWCLAAARRAEEDLVGANPQVLARVGADQDNFRAALEWALGGDDAAVALDLARCHAFVLTNRGRSCEAQDALRRALAKPDAPSVLRGQALWHLALADWFAGDMVSVMATTEEVLGIALAEGDRRLEGRAQQMLGCVKLFFDPDEARKCLEIALPLVREAGDVWAEMDVLVDYAAIVTRADDLEATAEWCERSLALAERHGNHWFLCFTLAFKAAALIRAGELAAARAATERALALSGTGDPTPGAIARLDMGAIELLRGAPERALAVVEAAIHDCTEAAAYVVLPSLASMRACALWALGSPDTGAAMQAALDVARQIDDPWQTAQVLLAQAAFCVLTGSTTDVEAMLAEARTCGAVMGSPYVPAAADLVAAMLAHVRGHADHAENLCHAALSVYVKHGYGLGVVDALESLAVLAAGQESWQESARLLGATAARRRALGYGHGRALVAPAEAAAREALGDESYAAAYAEGEALPIEAAVAYASRARGERKRPSSGWGSLTPMETEVAHLAAQGLSNPEIARKLFIAVGTTKIHLSNIYAKLGVANRTQLTAELTRRQAERQG